MEQHFERKLFGNIEGEYRERKLGETFKRITIFGTFSEPPERLKGDITRFGETLAKEGVTVLLGGQKGFPGVVKEGVVKGGGKALIAQPIERRKQGWVVENIPGHVRRIKVQDYEHIKDFLFHESVDAIIFLSPSKTLGTLTEAIESIDRMTYWGTIENPKLVPIIFVGPQWTDKSLGIPGINEKISLQQLIEGLIEQEHQAFVERGLELNKKDYIRFANDVTQAQEILREWQNKYLASEGENQDKQS